MPNGINPRVTNRAVQDTTGSTYPTNNPIHKGYGVKTPQRSMAYNAYFENQIGEKIGLFITDMAVGFEVGGAMAQSKSVRQFFPNNFVQPALQVKGITTSSYQKNKLANFVRMSHHYGVHGEQSERLVKFVLSDSSAFPTGDERFPYDGRRGNTKGRHKPWRGSGWIEGVTAGAKKEEHTPEYEITFMVVSTIQGLWKDEEAPDDTLESWDQIFWGMTKKQRKKMFVQQNEPAKKPSKGKRNNPQEGDQYGPWRDGLGYGPGDGTVSDDPDPDSPFLSTGPFG